MLDFILLLLVAVVVYQDVEVLKKIKDYFLLQDWKVGKFGIPISVAVAAWAGITLNIGIVSAILDFVQMPVILPSAFYYFDIFSSCLLLSQGASFIVDTLEKFKEVRDTNA